MLIYLANVMDNVIDMGPPALHTENTADGSDLFVQRGFLHFFKTVPSGSAQ